MPQKSQFQVTPEEDRFLRRFVRRHAGRYVLAAGALVALGVWAGMPAGGGAGGWQDPVAELRQANESLRQELAALRAEKARLGQEVEDMAARVQSVQAAGDGTSQIDQRVAALTRRIGRAESRIGQAGPSGPDLGPLFARLDEVEARQQRALRDRETFEKSVLNRLYAVEVRAARQDEAAGLPAAPAP